jgi:hypothetical protein
VQEGAGLRFPNLAGTVVAACDELIAVFVEGAVGEGQNMCLERLEEPEILLLLLLDFEDKLCMGNDVL